MVQTITSDISEWENYRDSLYSKTNEFTNNINNLRLSLPKSLEVKGYALAPVIVDDSGNLLECKSRLLDDHDSLANYDFSNCYILDYFMNTVDSPPLKEDFTIDPDGQWKFTFGRKIRYAGEEVKK